VTGKALIIAPSPAPSIISGNVVLYHHTWHGHIRPAHTDVLLGHVRQAMNDPCNIAESKTVPGAYLLLNTSAQNASGQILRVPVLPQEDGTNIVTSAYFADATSHAIIWDRGDG
jgi:hypothetical protein